MLTKQEYEQAKSAIAEWESNRNEKGVWTGPQVTQEQVDETNRLRSAVEVYEWMTNPPARYFLYIKETEYMRGSATTWTGEFLGHVFMGDVYRSNFGDKRQQITVVGTNGRKYHGIYYKSAGDYARVKLAKGQN